MSWTSIWDTEKRCNLNVKIVAFFCFLNCSYTGYVIRQMDDVNNEVEGLSKAQTYFFRAIQSVGVISGRQCKQLHQTALQLYPPGENEAAQYEDLQQFIIGINQHLQRDTYLNIDKAVSELNGNQWLVLVCNAGQNKDLTNLLLASVPLGETHLQLLLEIIDRVITSGEGCVSAMDCLNLQLTLGRPPVAAAADSNSITDTQPTKCGRGMTMTEKQTALSLLLKARYIGKTANGMSYYLEVNTLCGLSDYIHKKYGDQLKKCIVCAKPCIMGVQCSACDVGRLHYKCEWRQYDQLPAEARTCVSCRAPWSYSANYALHPPAATQASGL